MLALSDYISSQNIEAEAVENGDTMFRMRRLCPKASPLISIIIPTRDRSNLVKACVDGILHRTDYENWEVIIVDNDSEEEETFSFYRNVLEDSRFKVIHYHGIFNYSAINNLAVKSARGELLCLLNNDVEVIKPNWLKEMMAYAVLPDVGCVGARLLYEDDTLQHGGVIIGLGGVAGHSHKRRGLGDPGYYRRIDLVHEMSAVTAACLVCSKKKFEQVGGFEEEHLKVAFNDVDLCLKMADAGYRNIYNPEATLYHLESISRGSDDTPEHVERFRSEVAHMKKRWQKYINHDPAYNPNLTIDREDFSISWAPRVSRVPSKIDFDQWGNQGR